MCVERVCVCVSLRCVPPRAPQPVEYRLYKTGGGRERESERAKECLPDFMPRQQNPREFATYTCHLPGPRPHKRLLRERGKRCSVWQRCKALPKKARIQDSETFVSLNSRLERNREEGRGCVRCPSRGEAPPRALQPVSRGCPHFWRPLIQLHVYAMYIAVD